MSEGVRPYQPLISVVIPTYNGLCYLPACLDALHRQTYPASHYEVVVVDDASSDGTQTRLAEQYPEVRVLTLEHNSGLAVACNRGSAIARGEILVLLNNDTEAAPSWLEEIAAAFSRRPDAEAVASKLRLFSQRDRLHSAGDQYGIDGLPRNRGVWERDRGQYDVEEEVFGGCGGGVAYRREVWERLGGFDERLFMYLEDVDLAWRLRLAGGKTIFAPRACIYHHVSATGGGSLASYYTGRNTIWVLVLNYPGPLLRRYWRHIVAAQLGIAWDAVQSWRGAAARARLRGQLAGVKGVPALLLERRRRQAERSIPLQEIEGVLVSE